MSLSLNPISNIIQSASSLFSSKTNAGGGSLGGINFAESKAALDGTINRLSGGIGSSLNGMSAGVEDFGTALGGGGNPISSLVSSAGGALGSISNIGADIGKSINSVGIGGALGALGGLAGEISSAAGQLNNILSLFRGKNLPAAGELFENTSPAIALAPSGAEDWRVRINCNFANFGSAFQRLEETNGVVWPYTPSVSVSSKANYTQIDPVHSNYPFFAYKNSQIDDITISGDFSCETETDASYWIAATMFFKTATKMFFGNSAYSGNPPVICELSGYGPGVFDRVPVIIKNFTMELPEDVNYIKCGTSVFGQSEPTWVPVISKVSVTVTPIYNRSRLRKFSLQDYANGNAIGYI